MEMKKVMRSQRVSINREEKRGQKNKKMQCNVNDLQMDNWTPASRK